MFWLLYGPLEFQKTEVPRPYARRLDPAGVQKVTFSIYFMAENRVKQSVSLHFGENGVRNAISMKSFKRSYIRFLNSLRQNGHYEIN